MRESDYRELVEQAVEPTARHAVGADVRRRRKLPRAQPHDPITGRRASLTARTHGELLERVAQWRRVGHELATGLIDAGEAAERLEALRRGRAVRSEALLLRDAWDTWVGTLTDPETQRRARSVWRTRVAPWFGEAPVVGLTDGRLMQWQQAQLRAGLAPNTVRSLWDFLKRAVRLAYEMRQIRRLPWVAFRPVPPRAVTRRAATGDVAVLVRLVEAAASLDAELSAGRAERQLPDLARRVVIVALTGLRNGEAAGLAWDHVDLEAGELTVEHQAIDGWRRHHPTWTRPRTPVKNDKAEGPLVQRLHPTALEALEVQRAELEARGWYRSDGPVFPTRDGAWRSNANAIYPEDMHEIARRADVPHPERWVVHSLRNTFATLEARSGAHPRAVQRRIGHSTVEQTERYFRDDARDYGTAVPALVVPLRTEPKGEKR